MGRFFFAIAVVILVTVSCASALKAGTDALQQHRAKVAQHIEDAGK
jgi:hypothetical protein